MSKFTYIFLVIFCIVQLSQVGGRFTHHDYNLLTMNVDPPRLNIVATKRPSQWERIMESVGDWKDEFEIASTDALKSYNKFVVKMIRGMFAVPPRGTRKCKKPDDCVE